ncbi:MAG: SDR family oxidoreductase [Gammaproteobacteria bacterium]|nr:SDR family oxidoreductase [Gammaproteobacteria bacterium]
MGRFSGKVVALTGGAGGIGEATVRRFLDEGAKVAFCDTKEADGEGLARSLGEAGHDVRFVTADVQHEAEAARFIAEAAKNFDRLDVLVNNAGIRNYQDVTEASEESWERILGVNLKGYAMCAKAAIPVMRKGGGGVIINVASVRSLVAGPKMVQYDTSKAGILGLTRSMARDHASDNIRVVAIGPGPIFTAFHAERAKNLGLPEAEYVEAFGADTMMKRPGTPEEVANAILFLASDDASFVTGTCLYVDGGQTNL